MSVADDCKKYGEAFMKDDLNTQVVIEKRYNLYGYPQNMVHEWLWAESEGVGEGNKALDKMIGASA